MSDYVPKDAKRYEDMVLMFEISPDLETLNRAVTCFLMDLRYDREDLLQAMKERESELEAASRRTLLC